MSRARRPHDQRGLSESVQWTILTPLLLLVTLGIVQAGILLHGRTVATNAALAGAEAEALSGPAGGSGARVAGDVAARGGLKDVTVDVTRAADTVTVHVRGRTDSFFDLGLSRVDASAAQPEEVPR